ncbi:MAG: hypothetical protein ACRDRU_29910 [Pseudonocardiaceae bacterium]
MLDGEAITANRVRLWSRLLQLNEKRDALATVHPAIMSKVRLAVSSSSTPAASAELIWLSTTCGWVTSSQWLGQLARMRMASSSFIVVS